MTATAPAGRGLHLCLAGIDGIGKTSLSRALSTELEAAGVPVKLLSWRGELAAQPRAGTRTALRELWVESFRLMYLGAGDALALPPDYDRFAGEGWESRVVASPFDSNVPAGPLAAAWLEWVGQVLLHHEAIRPACAAGTWVIEDSPNLRMMYKQVVLARALAAGDPAVTGEIDHALSVLVDLFRRQPPDVGVVLSGSVDLAYRRRMAQSERLGAVEDMHAAAGARGWPGFKELQSDCDAFLRGVGESWGWLVFEVEDRPVEDNAARLLAELRRYPGIDAVLAGGERGAR